MLMVVVLVVLQVKDCYLVHLVQELHEKESKTMILFTPTCRYVATGDTTDTLTPLTH